MKKGTFFTNLFVLISVGCMYSIVLYLGYMDISTYISLGTLTVISLMLFWACFTGLNKISQITGCLKKVRKDILKLHVKDPEFVWDSLKEEKYIFKNSILDGEFNNFKKEMNRLEDEGAVYCQADMADYINEDIIFVNVKKRVLDSVAFVISMIGIVGILISLVHAMGIFQYSSSVKVVMQCLKPIVIMLSYTVFSAVMYTHIYKVLINNMCREYRLFIGDFYKYVVPCAKNDMANNILYLQQIQMQNNEKLSENIVELLSDKLNDTMVRQSEKFTELSRQIEGMTTILNKFNVGVDEFSINLKDMMENDRILSREQNKVLVDCFEKLEQDGIKVNGSLVSELGQKDIVSINENNVEQKDTVVLDESSLDITKEAEKEAEKEEPKKTTKKTTTKKSTTKKTTTKKTATKKATTKKTTAKKTTKKATEQDEKALSDIAEKRIKAAAMKIAEASNSLNAKEQDKDEVKEVEDTETNSNKEDVKSGEVVVDIAPAKKRRGRKTKAEKEAELKAALELAKKAQEEIKAKTLEEEKAKAEEKDESVEEVKLEEKAEPVEEVKLEEKAEQAEEVKSEEKAEIVEEVKQEEKAEPVEEVKQEEKAEQAEEVKSEEKAEIEKTENNVIAFRTEKIKEEDLVTLDNIIDEVVEIEVES